MFVKEKNKILIALFLVFSCSNNISTTNYQNIYVYTSEEDKNIVLKVLNENLFNFTYNTPKPERKYRPIYKPVIEFMNSPKHSLMMLVSIEEEKDTTVDLIANRLSGKGISLANNHYADEQLLFILNHSNQEDMVSEIDNYRDWILGKIKDNEFKKLSKHSLKSGPNEELISNIKNMFGINMYVQKDYKKIRINDDSNFLWIGRAFPYRWIVIYEDVQHFYQTPKTSWERLEYKFNDHLDIDVVSYKTQFETIDFQDDEMRKIYGVYSTKIDSKNPTGGPFITYIIDQNQTNKVLIVSGFVNFPGKDKIFHIKELEYIIETITKDE